MIKILSSIFGKRNSLFHTRYNCLNFRKQKDKDCVSFAVNINQLCERFNVEDLSIDMYKWLVFVQGLTASHDKAFVRKY